MIGYQNGEIIFMESTMLDKQISVYLNRFEKRYGRKVDYCVVQDLDNLDDVWKNLENNGYMFFPLKFKDSLKEFRKRNRITSPIHTLENYQMIQKENYAERSDELSLLKSIASKTLSLDDYTVPVPDHRLSPVTSEEFMKYCKPGLFLAVSENDVETIEAASRTGMFFLCSLMDKPESVRHMRIHHNQIDAHKTIDKLDELCQYMEKLKSDNLTIFFRSPNGFESLEKLLAVFRGKNITIISNNELPEINDNRIYELKSGFRVSTQTIVEADVVLEKPIDKKPIDFISISRFRQGVTWDIDYEN